MWQKCWFLSIGNETQRDHMIWFAGSKSWHQATLGRLLQQTHSPTGDSNNRGNIPIQTTAATSGVSIRKQNPSYLHFLPLPLVPLPSWVSQAQVPVRQFQTSDSRDIIDLLCTSGLLFFWFRFFHLGCLRFLKFLCIKSFSKLWNFWRPQAPSLPMLMDIANSRWFQITFQQLSKRNHVLKPLWNCAEGRLLVFCLGTVPKNEEQRQSWRSNL